MRDAVPIPTSLDLGSIEQADGRIVVIDLTTDTVDHVDDGAELNSLIDHLMGREPTLTAQIRGPEPGTGNGDRGSGNSPAP